MSSKGRGRPSKRAGAGAGPSMGTGTSTGAGDMAAKYVALLKGCRLCGAGAGYRMPIISKTPGTLTTPTSTLLATKIKDCLAIHVNSNDCMPPLICELCLDKVNDFYEFREMCRCTDQRIRGILGLPPQTVDNNSDDDCILGISVPVFINSKEANLASQPRKSALKKEKDVKEIIPKKEILPKKTEKRSKKTRSPSPPALLVKSSRKRKTREPSPPPVKKLRFSTPLPVERKSSRNSSPPPSKKRVKETPPPSSSKKASPAQPATPPITCTVCKMSFRANKQLNVHQNTLHLVNYWPQKQSCSPCGEWFATQKEADAHHRWHRSSNTYYTCKRCSTDFRVIVGYQKHLESRQCIPENEVPDPLCTICNRRFVTENLLQQHHCSGFGPPGENCPKCMENFATADQLRRHKLLCRVSMVELNPNNPHLQSLRCVSISMLRCDGLIPHIKQEPLDIKQEPEYQGYEDFTTLDNIKDEPDYSGYENDFGGDNDSYASSTEDNNAIPLSNLVRNPFARKSITAVDSLSVISLRTIFASPKLLGRKPRPKIKKEKDTSSDLFDNLFSNEKSTVSEEAPKDASEGANPFDILIQVNNPSEEGNPEAGDSKETNCESDELNNHNVSQENINEDLPSAENLPSDENKEKAVEESSQNNVPIEPMEVDEDNLTNISSSVPTIAPILMSPGLSLDYQNSENDFFADKSFIPEINLSGIISRLGEADGENDDDQMEESLLENNEEELILKDVPQKPNEEVSIQDEISQKPVENNEAMSIQDETIQKPVENQDTPNLKDENEVPKTLFENNGISNFQEIPQYSVETNDELNLEEIPQNSSEDNILEEVPQKSVDKEEVLVPSVDDGSVLEEDIKKINNVSAETGETNFSSETVENGITDNVVSVISAAPSNNDIVTNGDFELSKEDDGPQVPGSVLSENELLGDEEVDKGDVIENEEELLRDEPNEFPTV